MFVMFVFPALSIVLKYKLWFVLFVREFVSMSVHQTLDALLVKAIQLPTIEFIWYRLVVEFSLVSVIVAFNVIIPDTF